MIALVMWIEMRLRTQRHGYLWGYLGDYLAGMIIAKIVLLQPQLFSIPVLLAVIWLASHQTARAVRHGARISSSSSSLRLLSPVIGIRNLSLLDRLMSAVSRALSTQHPQTSADNCSLAQIIREHLGAVASILFVAAIRAGVLLLAGWFGRKGANDAMKNCIILSLACALPLLVWPIAWNADFLLAVPIVLLAFQPTTDKRGKVIQRWSLAAIALLMLSDTSLWSDLIWLDDPQSIAARMAGATLVLFCLAIANLAAEISNSAISLAYFHRACV